MSPLIRFLALLLFVLPLRAADRRLKPGAAIELYDLTNDRAETKNIAAEHPTELALIEIALQTARTESADWQIREGGAARNPKN